MGLGQDGGSDSCGEGGEELDSRNDLEVVPRGYADGLDVACARKKNQGNTVPHTFKTPYFPDASAWAGWSLHSLLFVPSLDCDPVTFQCPNEIPSRLLLVQLTLERCRGLPVLTTMQPKSHVELLIPTKLNINSFLLTRSLNDNITRLINTYFMLHELYTVLLQ